MMQTPPPPAYKKYIGQPFSPEIEVQLKDDEVEWRVFRVGFKYPDVRRDPFRMNFQLNAEEKIESIFWG